MASSHGIHAAPKNGPTRVLCLSYGVCGVQYRLQVFCDLAYTTDLPATGTFALPVPCSAMRTSQAAIQSTGGEKAREDSSFFFRTYARTILRDGFLSC